MSNEFNRVRVALNRSRPYAATGPITLINFLTGETPLIGFGRALRLEMALFKGGVGGDAGVLDSSSISSITVQLRNVTSGVIDITGLDIFNRSTGTLYAITAADWESDTANTGSGVSYHANIDFTAAEMGALGAPLAFNVTTNLATCALVFSGTTPQGLIPLGAALVYLYKDGGTGPGSGVAPTAAYTLTDSQLEARFASKLNIGENAAGVSFVLRGPAGYGILLYVDDSTGTPVLKESELPQLV